MRKLFIPQSAIGILHSLMVAVLLVGTPLPLAAETDLAIGAASGSFSHEGTTVDLMFAAGFVARRQNDKPLILLFSDTKLPSERWLSEFDIMGEKSNWSGVVFFLKNGEVFRTDIHVKGQQSSLSGYFNLKLDDLTAKELTGHATTKVNDKGTKLDVTFHTNGIL